MITDLVSNDWQNVAVLAVLAFLVLALWGQKITDKTVALLNRGVRLLLGVFLLAAAPALALTTPITRRVVVVAVLARRLITALEGLPFNRRAVAASRWPEAQFPELYIDVPQDMERPPFDDGRFVGGVSITHMIDRLFSRGLLESAIELGVLTATAFLVVSCVGVILWGTWPVLVALGQDVRPLETWGAGLEVAAPLTAKLGAVFSTMVTSAAGVVQMLAVFILLAVSIVFGLPVVIVASTINEAGAPWRLQTKDSRTRFRHRAELRNLTRRVYRQSVALATGYLKGSPIYTVGQATGLVRTRGDLTAPMPGQSLALDRESLHQHVLTLGGTGEGKTSAVIKPLIRQILAQDKPRYGLLGMDAKGVLWRDLKSIAEQAGRSNDVIVVGVDAGQIGLDVLAGLEPKDISAVCKALFSQQSGGDSKDDFWPSMAASIIRHCAELARAWQIADGKRHYTLTEIYRLALDAAAVKTAANAIGEAIADGKIPQSEALRDSVEYMLGTWVEMAAVTKTGIVANVSQLLDPLAGSDALRRAFCEGQAGADISSIFAGKIVLFALSSLEHGMGARLISMLAKTSVYRAARLREMRIGSQAAQAAPVVVAIDEAQELLTADASGMSDGTFWNVARSSGVAGIIGTQTVAALKQVLGEDATANIIQQFRSKIVLRTEDKETHEMCIELAGEQLRAFAYEETQRESLEARFMLDGFDPLLHGNPAAVAQTVADCQRGVMAMARIAWRFIRGATTLDYAHSSDYSVDDRFSFGLDEGVIGRKMQATWRAEDLDRKYLADGNEHKPVLAVADLIAMGRFHAYAHIQRAGAARQDIIEVTHDFN